MTAKGWESRPERRLLASPYHLVAEIIGWDRAIAFGMAVWKEKRPPSRGKSDPTHGGGRGVIYVPNSLYDGKGQPREIVRLAGAEVAAKLVRTFAGEFLEFPSIIATSIKHRNKAIAQQCADGISDAAVALLFDLTERQIRRIKKVNSSHLGTARHGS